MSAGSPGLYEFGRFRLDARRRLLQCNGRAVQLNPKAFNVLTTLVAGHGRVVEKAEILDAVWPDTAVEDGNLTVNISMIRRALGESRTDHPFIVTIPGRGYQFVGDVRLIRDAPPPVPSATGDQPPAQAAGTAVGTSGRRRFLEQASSVGVRHFAVASMVLLAVALPIGLLDTRAGGDATTVEDAEARALYLRGRYLLSRRTEDSLAMGQRYFERAIERAPEYASAHAGLADAHSMQAHFGTVPPSDAYPRAMASALKALELDPDSAEAHTSMAYIRHRFEWNWPAAEQNFRKAIALDPTYALAHHWYGSFLDSVGRRNEGIAEARRAELLDPLTQVISANLNEMLRPGTAHDFFDRGYQLLEMDPGFWLAHLSIAGVYHSRGQRALAVEEYERAAELAGRGTYVLSRLGVAYADAGRSADAKAILQEFKTLEGRRYVSPFVRVPILAALGERDEAFAWLGRAYDERSTQLAFIGVGLSELATDPRFDGFLTRVGLR